MDRLRFGRFVWPNNPTNTKMKCAKNIESFNIPYTGSLMQNYGGIARVFTGEGEFHGSSALLNFFRLYSLFREDGSKQLYVPGFANYAAYFTEYNFIGEPGPGIVKYTFTFVEDVFTDAEYTEPIVAEITAASGDTLWSLSAEYGVPFQYLVELNPLISDPMDLPEGSVIFLK